MTQLTASTTKRSFRVHSLLRWLAWPALVCGIAVLLIAVVSKPEERVILPWMVLFMAVVLGIVALFIYSVRLEVSPEGIVCYYPGMRIRTSWDNIEGYAYRTMSGWKLMSLVLREPGLEISGWMRPFVGFSAAMPTYDGMRMRRSVSEMEKAIPVSMFAADWRTGDLGALIRQYAPEAFDKMVD